MGSSENMPANTAGSVDNIRAMLPDVIPTGSKSWYANARRQIRAAALAHGYPVDMLTGVVAALSPGRYWTRNISDALKFLAGKSIPLPCGSNPLVTAAAVVKYGVAGIPLTQVKVLSFYDNLTRTEDSTAVTVDSHAARIWAGDKRRGSIGFSARMYERIAADYKALAEELGVRPHEIQSAVWQARVEG